MSWNPIKSGYIDMSSDNGLLSRSAPEPDGTLRVQWQSEQQDACRSMPESSSLTNQYNYAYNGSQGFSSPDEITGSSSNPSKMISYPSHAEPEASTSGYIAHNGSHPISGTPRQSLPYPYISIQSFGSTNLPSQSSVVQPNGGSHFAGFTHGFGQAPMQYQYPSNDGIYLSPPVTSFYNTQYTDAQSAPRNISVSLPTRKRGMKQTFRPRSPSNLHEVMRDRRLPNTSGDSTLEDSALFKHDESPKTAYLDPIMTGPSSSFHPKAEIEGIPSPFPGSAIESDDGTSISGQSTQYETPTAGIVLDIQRDDFFPNNIRLQNLWRGLLQASKIGKGDLYPFLQPSGEGKRRTWHCLFSDYGDSCAEVFSRRDKGVAHLLKVHLQKHPIPCNGECGKPECLRSFASIAAKSSHTRDQHMLCPKCHQATSTKNLRRHQNSAKCRQRSEFVAGGALQA